MINRGLAVLFAILLAAPLAAAEWSGRGFYEPDTLFDRESGMMFQDPDVDPSVSTRKVYFNAYTYHIFAGVNPNVGAMGSSRIAGPLTGFNAFLGVWKDCNQDGYIGQMEGALLEYRAELLLEDTVCKATASAHNDGEWVYEFLWIGPDRRGDSVNETATNPWDDNPTNLVDEEARVWGDIGRPEDGGAVTCPVRPLPRGTLLSTGGLLRYADCIAAYRGHMAFSLLAPLDGTGGLQFSFNDAEKENPQNSTSVFNQRNPYGAESDGSSATVWDCEGQPTQVYDPTAPQGQPGMLRTVGVKDPTDTAELDRFENSQGYLVASLNVSEEDGRLLLVRPVGSPSTHPGGSPAGTLNETLEGAPDAGTANDADCDRSNGGFGEEADIYAWAETDFEPSTPRRTAHDFWFTFSETAPVGESLSTGNGTLGKRSPVLLGAGFYRDGLLNTMKWSGAPSMLASRNPLVRLDDFTPQGPQHFTFYAHVGSEASASYSLLLPGNGISGTYGSEHCSGTSETTGKWSCDADKWWRDSFNKKIKTVWQVDVGHEYHLIDLDCYDETYFEGQPVTTTKTITGLGCAR